MTIVDALDVLTNNRNNDLVRLLTCNVESVDIANRSCVVTTISGAVSLSLEVSLQASVSDGLIIEPKINSTVFVLFSKNTKPFIIQFSDIENYIFNGVDFGGFVKVIELTEKLNNLENKLNDLITACSNQIVTLAPSGTFPLASFFTTVTPLTATQQTEIENQNIKHG
jgi:hypothetical protein